jgi:hypothetical protein
MTREPEGGEARPERRDGPTGHAKGPLIERKQCPFGGTVFGFLSVLFLGTEFVCFHLSVPVCQTSEVTTTEVTVRLNLPVDLAPPH